EEAGWIERRPDPADRRARRLYLTAKAWPVLGRILSVATETRDEALVRLSPAEADQLLDLLTRVHATLSDRVPVADGEEPAVGPSPRRPPSILTRAAEPADAPVPAVEARR